MGHHGAQNHHIRAQRPPGGLDNHPPPRDPYRLGFDEDTYTQWADLDRVLVQLWQSYSIRTKLVYAARGEPEADERVCGFAKNLLPETTKGGAIDLMDNGVDLR